MAKPDNSNWGVLVPRVLLAVVFTYHGAYKLFGMFGAPPDTMEKMIDLIGKWGWPAPKALAYAAAITEFFGGLCVGIGLLTRFWATGLAITMAVAALKVHWVNGFGGQGGWEYCFVLGVLALSVAVQGGGPFALDSMLVLKKKTDKPPA